MVSALIPPAALGQANHEHGDNHEDQRQGHGGIRVGLTLEIDLQG
jgi:hypothetical protein